MKQDARHNRFHWLIAVASSLIVYAAHAANDFYIEPGATGTIVNGAPMGNISGQTLSNALAKGEVTISSTQGSTANGSGNIYVNDVVSWSANKLILNAQKNININASLNGSGTASLTLQYRQGAGSGDYFINAPVNLPAGQNFSTKLGSNGATDYTVITALGVAKDAMTAPAIPTLQGMAVTANLSTNYALGSNIDARETSTWNSDGTSTPAFAGFAPIGNSTNSFTGNFDGLGHTISNLTISRATEGIGLLGYTSAVTVIQNIGMVGGSISGKSNVGGLVGSSAGAIINSYANSNVNGTAASGGLVGVSSGTVSNSYATGNVSCVSCVMGSSGHFGGLVGVSSGTVSNSYATGNVNGSVADGVGGLVGYVNSGTVSTSYAAGKVTGTGNYSRGGLVGYSAGTVSNSYWNTETSGQKISSGGGLGLTTAQMQTASSFTGFDFTNTWAIVKGATYPMLATYSTIITNVYQLQLMANNLGANYILGANIDASPTASGNVWGSSGFFPVGNATTQFTGNLDGHGYTIGNLTINRPTTDYVGLFGKIGNQTRHHSVIQNVRLSGGSVSGRGYIGSLIGRVDANSGAIITVSSSCATGSVSGKNTAGGLIGGVGASSGAAITISNSCATGSVSGENAAGGLIGGIGASSGAAITISSSFATGNVTGIVNPSSGNGPLGIGGLIGGGDGASAGAAITIGSSYATGNVTGNQKVGGVIGECNGVAGSRNKVVNSYATGNVTGSLTGIGGLVGMVEGMAGASHTVTNSYATGNVTGSLTGIGGLVGMVKGSSGARHTVIGSFWDTVTSQQPGSAGGFGMNTANMQTQANFTSATAANGNVNPGWDFTNVWQMGSGSYPMLQHMP